MKRLLLLPAAAFVLLSCAGLPAIVSPDKPVPGGIAPRCDRLYLEGRWQFQHVIEATYPGGRQSVLLGVSTISADTGHIDCVLMTIEGVVVFNARYDGEIHVLRAVVPFDSENFAEGLINDMRLIFLRPADVPTESGTLADGSFICRYRQAHGPVVDIVKISDYQWELRQYDRRLSGRRTVDLFYREKPPLSGFTPPDRLKLATAGYTGYTLDMDLIEAVPMEEKQK